MTSSTEAIAPLSAHIRADEAYYLSWHHELTGMLLEGGVAPEKASRLAGEFIELMFYKGQGNA